MSRDNDNKVTLVGVYGSDEAHALSAWTSTNRDLTDEKRSRIPSLLTMLAREGHHTPFEKSALHFLVTSDIATHIHIIKHRIGVSVNAESARYKELRDDKVYRPIDWTVEELEIYDQFTDSAFALYHSMLKRLVDRGVDRKRAKESARFFLPYGNQITADVQFNFRSFMHFLGLRYKATAQLEVRQVAEQMLQLLIDEGSFVHSLKAFGYVEEDANGVLKAKEIK